MNEKNKHPLKDFALVIADQIVSNIPALNMVWGTFHFSKMLITYTS